MRPSTSTTNAVPSLRNCSRNSASVPGVPHHSRTPGPPTIAVSSSRSCSASGRSVTRSPRRTGRPKLLGVLRGPAGLVADHALAELVLADLRLAALSPVLVLRGDHLVDVLHLQLDLGLI